MRIAITGSSGLIGSSLVDHFTGLGHAVTRIVRQSLHGRRAQRVVQWDISSGRIDSSGLEGHDVFIHLAGAGIADHRWSDSYKETIRSSRIDGTMLLAEAISRLDSPPKVLISTSAIGFYGNHGPYEVMDEHSCVGSGFLPQVCEQWEKATKPAELVGIRVVHMRLGLVLSSRGGGLARMLPVFRSRMGGKIGSGRQMISWIALEEIPFVVDHLIAAESISGAVNAVSPCAVSNDEFTKILAGHLQCPAAFCVPSFGIRLLFGEMGQALLLEGARVVPRRLEESGYIFRYPDLETALKTCI